MKASITNTTTRPTTGQYFSSINSCKGVKWSQRRNYSR